MTIQEIINKLRELGIDSENCYSKSSFVIDEEPVVGLYKNEFASDFYFYTKFNKTLYVLRKTNISKFKEDIFMGKTKWIVPLSQCEIVWKDKPLEEIELPDQQFSKMSLRQYACIHLKVPGSGIDWLDNLIKESRNPQYFNL